MPWMRLRLGKNMTRPPYSPMRLGVKMAQVSPQNTHSIAFHTDMGDNTLVRRHHFKDSSTQFTNISNTTTDMVMITLLRLSPATRRPNSCRFLLSLIM